MLYFVTAIMSTPLYPLSYVELVYTVSTIGNDLITFKVRYIMNLCFTLLRLSCLRQYTHCHTWEHGACLHSVHHRQRPYNIQGKIHYEPMLYFVTAIMSAPLYPLSYVGDMELVYTVSTIGNDLITFKVRYIINLFFTLLWLSCLYHYTHCHTWGTRSLSTQCPP